MEGFTLVLALNQDGKLVSIYDVPTGVKCNCTCPCGKCGQKLVAKNKNKYPNVPLKEGQKEAHFAYHNGVECTNAPESALHKLAKEVLLETKTILIPPYEYKTDEILVSFDNAYDEKILRKGKDEIVSDVFLEKELPKAKRKAVLSIEFYKSHKVDNEKYEKYKRLNISCIEINVNGVSPLYNGKPNKLGMKSLLEDMTFHKEWIYNSQHIEKPVDLKKIEYQQIDKEEPYPLVNYYDRFMDNLYDKYEWYSKKGYTFLKAYGKEGEEMIYCPKIKKPENNKIDCIECIGCKYEGDDFIRTFKQVACGYKNKLTVEEY